MNIKKLITIIAAILIIVVVSSAFGLSDSVSQITQNKSEVSQTISPVISSDNNDFQGLEKFMEYSGFANVTLGHIVMIFVGLFFIFLAIR